MKSLEEKNKNPLSGENVAKKSNPFRRKLVLASLGAMALIIPACGPQNSNNKPQPPPCTQIYVDGRQRTLQVGKNDMDSITINGAVLKLIAVDADNVTFMTYDQSGQERGPVKFEKGVTKTIIVKEKEVNLTVCSMDPEKNRATVEMNETMFE